MEGSITDIQQVTADDDYWIDYSVDAGDCFVEGIGNDGKRWRALNGTVTELVEVYRDPLSGEVALDGVPYPVPDIGDFQTVDHDAEGRFVFGRTFSGEQYMALNGQIVRVSDAGGAPSDWDRDLSYNPVTGLHSPADGSATDRMILVVGQSLANGSTSVASDQPITTVAEHPGYALMAGAQPWNSSDAVTEFQDLREVRQGDGAAKETVCSGMADRMMREFESQFGYKPRLIFKTVARGGQAYYGSQTNATGGLKRGSEGYSEVLRVLRQSKAVSTAEGRQLEVVAVVIIHGEQDHNEDTTRENYARALANWIGDLSDDIRLITGQPDRAKGYLTQVSRWDDDAETQGVVSRIANAQLDAQALTPGLRMVGPIYFGDQSGDNSHPAPRTYRQMGQMIGDALLADLWGPYWTALYVVDGWWVGTAGSATRNTFDSTLVVGAAGQPEGTLTGRINGGDIADVMVWSVVLHLRTDLRDLVESYSQARYPSVGT
ncbi:hypothetical protein [Thioclava sp. GXIMD4215]|uniref:hypothetical protein n=1 Tax=Thioclava sp. GXIMD4215 TaxID=3131928 RepID=UPI00311B0156